MNKGVIPLALLLCILFNLAISTAIINPYQQAKMHISAIHIDPSNYMSINAESDPIYDPLTVNPTIANELGLNYLISQGWKGEGTTIAVLDTGINYEDLRFDSDGNASTIDDRRVTNSVSFADGGETPMDVNGHGTEITGLLVSKPSSYDNITFSGIVPSAHIWNVKVLGWNGTAGETEIINGLEYCREHAENISVINLSFGAIKDVLSEESLNAIETAVRNCWDAGIVVVSAAGNEGDITSSDSPPFYTVTSPSSTLEAICVGAMGLDRYIPDFSSLGPSPLDHYAKPELVAPGYDLISTSLSGQIALGLDGTSFSSPIVCGGIAMVLGTLSYKPSPNLVKAALLDSCTTLGYTFYEEGAGFPNFTRMAELLADPTYVGTTIFPKTINFPNFFDSEKEAIPVNTKSIYPDITFPYIKATVIVGKPLIEGLTFTMDDILNRFIQLKEIPSVTEEGQYVLGVDFIETALVRSVIFLIKSGDYSGNITIKDGGVILAHLQITANISILGIFKVWWGMISLAMLPFFALVIVVVKRKKVANAFNECPKGWICQCEFDGSNCRPITKK
jgi:serine protease AprX